MKIGLQIVWIEEYFSCFFFDVHLAFKGWFRSIIATICDQSCLNMITIESRTQGDHEELKILLQKCLISSPFNQKLSLQERRTFIYRKIKEKCGFHSSWFPPSDLHRIVLMKPGVHVQLAECTIKSWLSDFINEIDNCEIGMCFDYDRVDSVQPN